MTRPERPPRKVRYTAKAYTTGSRSGGVSVIDRRSRLSRAKKVTLPDNAAIDVEADLGIWHGFHGRQLVRT